MPPDQHLLLLDPRDNVLVVRSTLRAGQRIAPDGAEITLARDIPLGHKVARHAIPAGGKVMKYGAPIGSAVADIAPGEHVHVHNMKSDYTPTYSLEAERAADAQAR